MSWLLNAARCWEKNDEESDNRFILPLRDDPCLEIGLFDPVHIDLPPPFKKLPRHPFELALGRRMQEHLAGLEKGDQVLAHPDRDRGVAKARKAPQGPGFGLCGLRDLLLHLQAGPAGPVGLGEKRAEWILVLVAGEGKLEGLHRPQAERESRGVREGTLVITPDLGSLEVFDDALAA